VAPGYTPHHRCCCHRLQLLAALSDGGLIVPVVLAASEDPDRGLVDAQRTVWKLAISFVDGLLQILLQFLRRARDELDTHRKVLLQSDADLGLPLRKFCGACIVHEFAKQLNAFVRRHPTLFRRGALFLLLLRIATKIRSGRSGIVVNLRTIYFHVATCLHQLDNSPVFLAWTVDFIPS
jgi:hypothetical protein